MANLHRRRRIFAKRARRFFHDINELLAPRAKAWLIGGAAGAAAIAVLCITLFSRPKVAAGTQALALSRGVPEETNYVEIVLTPSPTPVPTPTPTPDPTLKRGIEGEPVQQLQERLMQLGYLDLDESTQLYGPATAAAVRLFQRQVAFTETLGTAITEDGVAGEQTLHLIYSDTAPKYIVKEGMRGDDVTNMQKQLKDMGYMSETTGYYGEKTIAAIKDFQRRNGLSADGLAGTYTYELLYSPNAKESASKVQAARTKASVSKMIEIAKSKMGSTYILGKTGPSSFDCSGLVYYCLKQAGSNRRRLSAAGYSQVSDWEKISSINSLKKGDLIFFYNDGFSKVGHVGIVVSSGMMIDASSANGKVVKRSFSTTYWKKHFVCGRRPW